MFQSSCNSNRKEIEYRCNSNIIIIDLNFVNILHCNVIDSMTMSTGVMAIMTILTLSCRLKIS